MKDFLSGENLSRKNVVVFFFFVFFLALSIVSARKWMVGIWHVGVFLCLSSFSAQIDCAVWQHVHLRNTCRIYALCYHCGKSVQRSYRNAYSSFVYTTSDALLWHQFAVNNANFILMRLFELYVTVSIVTANSDGLVCRMQRTNKLMDVVKFSVSRYANTLHFPHANTRAYSRYASAVVRVLGLKSASTRRHVGAETSRSVCFPSFLTVIFSAFKPSHC